MDIKPALRQAPRHQIEQTLQVVRHMLPGLYHGRRQAVADLRHLRQFVADMPGWCRTNRTAIQHYHDPSQQKY
jgi:hypothetical protein